ncbi:MAG: ParB/RepB/Spo0J family partition protein [Gemmataceae bacterium]|nr:ParB/RepB/Spo0J family partition protein [Gemmataceae bacterium]
MDKKARLGRGLDALIGNSTGGYTTTSLSSLVPIDQVETNPNQPRKSFHPDDLASLEESIRSHGILQPLLVRQMEGKFHLIAGERRLRAAKAAGLVVVPVHMVEFNDQEVMEAALVENIHRADLNPIEKALGFKDYLDKYQVTHEQLAKKLGLGRPTVSNLVALLELPPEVQEAVRVGQITTGHAKVLKGVEDKDRQAQLCKEIVTRGLSVHATELLARQAVPQAAAEVNYQADLNPESNPHKTPHVQALEEEFIRKLGVKAEIKVTGKEKGRIVIPFHSNADFERICEILRK